MRPALTTLLQTLVLATGGLDAQAANLPVAAGDTAALVSALEIASANGEDDVVVLAPGAIYSLTAPDHQVTGLPEVAGRVVVQGNGATIQRTGDAEFRILDVGPAGDLTLDQVTIKGGKVTFITAPPPIFSDGGAGIRVLGTGKLTITNGTVTQNTCTGAVCFGGGILANDDQSPEVTLIDSTVSGNSAENGGGICLRHNDQILRLTRTTISGNAANEGGGIATYGHDDVTIVDSSVRGNSVSQTASNTLRNTIVAGNSAPSRPDCSALGSSPSGLVFDSFILTEGHNIVGNSTGCTGFVATAGDLIGTDPLLDALGDNGGPTQTRALLVGSPALDAGDPGLPGTDTACEATDQRGIGRPQGVRCDIGAYEREVSVPATTVTTTLPVTSSTTTTLPGGCAAPAAPTFVSIDCRLDVLVARVQSAKDLGRLERSLEGIVTKVRAKKIQAEDFDARARRKQSLNALKKAIARMRSFIHKLRSLPGRKVIPLGTSTELQDAANPILDDMKTLRTAL
jgi:hypothetical protein